MATLRKSQPTRRGPPPILFPSSQYIYFSKHKIPTKKNQNPLERRQYCDGLTHWMPIYIYIYHRWTGPFYHTNNLMPGLATWKTQKNIGPFKIMHPNFSWRSKRLGSLCLLEGVKRRGSLWSNLVLIWRYLPDVCPSQLPHHANTYLKRGFNFFSFWVFLPNC